MVPHTGPLTGISSLHCKSDLSDLAAALDQAEALGVDSIELPIYDMDLVIVDRVLGT